MKYILTIFLIAMCSAKSFGQFGNDTTKYLKYDNQYGQRLPRVWATKVLMLPQDTIFSKSGIAVLGTTVYTGNGTKWTGVTGTGGSGTDSVANALYGIKKTVVGTSRYFAFDSAVVRKMDSSYMLNDSVRRNIINGKNYDQLQRGGPVKLYVDATKGLSLLNDSTLSQQLKSINGVTIYGPGNITVAAGISKYYSITEVDTINVQYANGSNQKFSLTANRAIKFTGWPDGGAVDLVITHAVAGTVITNVPSKLPWDFYWATGTGEITLLSGIYDSTNAKWNWNFGIQDALLTPLYTTHVMLAFTDFARPKLKTWYAGLKAAGYNAVWLHDDGYNSPTNYNRLRESLDSSYAVGMKSILGISINESAVEAANVITDSWDHPGLQWYRGRRLIFSYDFDSAKLSGMIDTLTNRGYARSKYWLVVSTLYPTYSGSAWTYKVGSPNDSASVAQVYNHYPFVDGISNFSVDKGTSVDSVVIRKNRNENLWITQASRAQGKISCAGVSAMYLNPAVQMWNVSYAGQDTLWKRILQNQPDIVSDITANDQYELSYNTLNMRPIVGGSSYLPDTILPYNFGANIYSYPQLDHSGLQKAARPYVDAFLEGRSTIRPITQDKIFIDYTLHPKTAAAYTTVPAELANNPTFNATGFWAGTPYANVPSWASNPAIFPKFNTIKVAAHLIAPAQLRINGTLSGTTFPAGLAYYEVAQSLGTVTVEIVRSGVTVATGTSSKPISNNRWPGGGNAMFEQIY